MVQGRDGEGAILIFILSQTECTLHNVHSAQKVEMVQGRGGEGGGEGV